MNTLTPANIENGFINNQFERQEFLTMWEAWIKDRAATTQQGYNVAVRAFIYWLVENDIKQPTRADIVNYRDYLLTAHPSRKNGEIITLSADTAARYFRGVKMFFAFLEDNGLYKDITKNIRSPKTKPGEFKRDYLEREDILKILRSIDRSTEAGKRNYCLVLAIVSCAFRIIEIQRANIEDLEARGGAYRLYIQGKGHLDKDTYKKIEPELYEAIIDYLSTRPAATKEAPLFSAVGSNAKPGGGRLAEPSISRIIKNILVKAGYNSNRITAHSLRHTSVTLDRKAGGTLEEASRHARHSNITITQRYDHILEKAESKDERRIIDYIFKGEEEINESSRAADLLEKIPKNKRRQALEMLEALTT